jgi:hypothetical protein
MAALPIAKPFDLFKKTLPGKKMMICPFEN